MQVTRISFASSAFYRLGTVIFGCITRNMQHTTLLHVSPSSTPTGDKSKTLLGRCVLPFIPLSTPVRRVVYMFFTFALPYKLDLFLVCSVLHYKDTTNF